MYIFGKWQKIDNLICELDNISGKAKELNCEIHNTSIEDIIDMLDSLSKEWKEGSPIYIKAQELLLDELSFSSEMISASLNMISDLLSRESLEQRIKLELDDIEKLDRPVNIQSGSRVQYMPLGTILHVTAGNV